MATYTPGTSAPDTTYAEEGTGWITFAGILLSIIGVLNVVYGIAAISNSKFYVRDVSYVFSDLKTWGWVVLIIGAIQFCAAFSVFAGTEWGRWVGIITAALNSVAQLFFLPSYPFLALAIFTLDILVIYGLVAYGGRRT